MKKTYYQHSIWCENSDEWIESDKDTFEDEVIAHRGSFIQRWKFEDHKTTYFFDNRYNSAYDWKVVSELERS